MVRYLFRILLLVLLIPVNVLAQNIVVRAFTDTSDYNVGDYIHYTVEIEYDKNITLFTPDIKKSLSNVDVLSEEPAKTEIKENKVVSRFKFILSRYDSADVVIPPVPVKYGADIDTSGRVTFLAEEDTTLLTGYSNEVKFSIHLLKVNVEEDIKDIKAPLTILPDWKIIAMWIAIGLIALVLILYLIRKYLRKKALIPVKEKVRIIPPHIKALEQLRALEQEKLWQKGEIKLYHSRITEIIRIYFEERFSLPAPELSTSEILQHLDTQSGAEDIKALTASFLNNADLVKFARYIPLNSINEEMMTQALEIVERTKKIEVGEETNV